MGKGSSSAPQPDPNIGKAALQQAQTGEEWLNFAKDAFKVSTDRQADLDALQKEVMQRQLGLAEDQQDYTKNLTDKQLALAQDQQDLAKNVTDEQLAQSKWQFENAQKDRQRYEDVFQPVEDQFVEEASNYDTPERQAEAAAEAKGDVLSAAADAKAAGQRQAAALGINPASGRYAGIDRAGDMATTLASAGAQNNARQAVRDKGLALKADVANLGRGLPAQSATAAAAGLNASNSAVAGSNAAAGLGINTGNSAIGNMGNAAQLGINASGLGLTGALNANQQYLASTDIMGSGFKGAMAGYAGEASTLNNQYANQVNAWEAQQRVNAANASGLGSFLGGVAGLFVSDEDAKKDKKAIKDGAALEAVKDMPVEEWTYRDGVADEGRHVGPYAQDFHAATGKGDGRTIPAQDAIGITMKAVQDLDQKVDKIADAVGLGTGRKKPPAKRRTTQNPKRARVRQPSSDNKSLGLGVAA